MNALIKFFITTACIIGLLGIFSLFGLSSFGIQVTSTANWLFDSLLPFKGVLNLPAITNFILELFSFEFFWWSFIIAEKIFAIYTGSYIRTQGRMSGEAESPHNAVKTQSEYGKNGTIRSVKRRI